MPLFNARLLSTDARSTIDHLRTQTRAFGRSVLVTVELVREAAEGRREGGVGDSALESERGARTLAVGMRGVVGIPDHLLIVRVAAQVAREVAQIGGRAEKPIDAPIGSDGARRLRPEDR